MPSFTKGPAYGTPFGQKEYLRSTKNLQFESYTVAKSTIPSITIDGVATKILYPGVAMAKITSGPDAGKVGPVQVAGTDEVQTLTESGTISGGTYTITVFGVTTGAIAFDAVAATIQTAVRAAAIQATDAALAALGAYIEVTGGPVHTTPVSITFNGQQGVDVGQVTVDTASLTGTTPGITVATATPGAAGATDGRQTAANFVGINDTFLPTQLLHHDENIAVLYHGTCVQAWCKELSAAGTTFVTLTNTTRDALRGTAGVDLMFV